MENEFNEALENPPPEVVENEQPVYTPRPAYLVWAARVGLVIVIAGIILYYLQIARGGL